MDSAVQKFVGGWIFVILSVLLLMVIPVEVEVSTPGFVGPRMWPALNAIFLGICGITFLVSALRKQSFSQLLSEVKSGGRSLGAKRQLVFVLIAVAYIAAIDILGFILATIIGLQIFFPYFGSKRYVVNLILSVLTALIIFFLFSHVLQIRLPLGMLF